MKEEQKYLEELRELKLFSELYQKFYDKMKFSLSDIQKKAFETVFYDTQKIYGDILTNRKLSLNNSAIEFIPMETPSLNINLNRELSELRKLVDTPIEQISSEWFYLFVIISHNLKLVLTQKNQAQNAENLIVQRYCEGYVKRNQLGRINGGKGNSSIYNLQRKIAESAFVKFKDKYPELIRQFKKFPKSKKPKTELKKMIYRELGNTDMSDRTLQRWARILLENDGILTENTTTSS